jgi:hypothetical protein
VAGNWLKNQVELVNFHHGSELTCELKIRRASARGGSDPAIRPYFSCKLFNIFL